MTDMKHNNSTPAASKQAEKTWRSFITISKISGVVTAVILILMAILLV